MRAWVRAYLSSVCVFLCVQADFEERLAASREAALVLAKEDTRRQLDEMRDEFEAEREALEAQYAEVRALHFHLFHAIVHTTLRSLCGAGDQNARCGGGGARSSRRRAGALLQIYGSICTLIFAY